MRIFFRYNDSLTSMEAQLLQLRTMQVGTDHESNSISELKFTLRLNSFGLLDSSCIRESLSSVFDVFVIAVYLPSLRPRNFLRTEGEREAEFTSLLSFRHSPAHRSEHLQLK